MILLLLLLAAIVLGFWIDDALPPRIARYMPEASSSLVIGMVAGAITAAFASETRQTEFLSFSPEVRGSVGVKGGGVGSVHGQDRC